jgi:outer membrane protein assembly factor BamB
MKPGYVHPDSVGSDHQYSLHVLAVHARTGKILWTHQIYDGPMFDDRHRKNNYASPSAVTDGKLVYFFFESGGLLAYDVDGAPKWKVSLGGIAKAGLGPGTSPVIYEDLIIVQCDQRWAKALIRHGRDRPFIAAFDRFTGKPVWKTERNNRRMATLLPDDLAAPSSSRRSGSRHRVRPAHGEGTLANGWDEGGIRSQAMRRSGSCSCLQATRKTRRWSLPVLVQRARGTARASCGDTRAGRFMSRR